MSKHTPGPWTAEWHLETRHPKDHPQWHVEDGLDCVADVYGGGANARLIAAAPDLLAALQACRRVLGIRDDFVPLGHAAELASIIDKAIAKAERE